MPRVFPAGTALLIFALVVGLPLAGALLAGRTLAEFTQFPPPGGIPTGSVPFSKLAVTAVAAVLAAVTLPWLFGRRRLAPSRKRSAVASPAAARKFPTWGWAALAWTLVWWTLAWTRWKWFSPLQLYTFFPLWLGFIVTMNAAVERRTGSCLMRRAPRRWLALFAASAGCWWAFEWLNRFVQNWHYLNTQDFGAIAYFLHASLCFSTVLPGVAAVAEWLGSHRGWNEIVGNGPAWGWLGRRDTAVGLVVFGCASLLATGLRPEWFYPALWVSPLALLLVAPARSDCPTLRRELAGGDWRRAATWMIAALVCGFFWELWNWHSVAKWIYTVPGVDRWRVFEMPVLGYAGYLPFGLECLLVAEWVIGDRWLSARDGAPHALASS